jgi:hypothetical protein
MIALGNRRADTDIVPPDKAILDACPHHPRRENIEVFASMGQDAR